MEIVWSISLVKSGSVWRNRPYVACLQQHIVLLIKNMSERFWFDVVNGDVPYGTVAVAYDTWWDVNRIGTADLLAHNKVDSVITLSKLKKKAARFYASLEHNE